MRSQRNFKHYYKSLKVRNYHTRNYRVNKRLGPRSYSASWLLSLLVYTVLVPVGFVGITLSRQEYHPPQTPVGFTGNSTAVSILDIKQRQKLQTLGISTSKNAALTAVLNTTDVLSLPVKIHNNITTTVFWVGEAAGPANDYIPNNQSAWDGSWKTHYGGTDNPSARNGYLPSGFAPKENPFYFALPYNDLDAKGNRKASAALCPGSSSKTGLNYSWCKNTWIMIKTGSRVAYAQWEDVGPNEEDDPGYVFGTNATPKNTFDSRAGLDISPAVRDYLGVGDVSTTEWYFIDAASVPAGPWKLVITTTLGDSVK
ncbi:hypothetical protein BH10PAT3_BH10PAT3_6360 [soil metagenome]